MPPFPALILPPNDPLYVLAVCSIVHCDLIGRFTCQLLSFNYKYIFLKAQVFGIVGMTYYKNLIMLLWRPALTLLSTFSPFYGGLFHSIFLHLCLWPQVLKNKTIKRETDTPNYTSQMWG